MGGFRLSVIIFVIGTFISIVEEVGSHVWDTLIFQIIMVNRGKQMSVGVSLVNSIRIHCIFLTWLRPIFKGRKIIIINDSILTVVERLWSQSVGKSVISDFYIRPSQLQSFNIDREEVLLILFVDLFHKISSC